MQSRLQDIRTGDFFAFEESLGGFYAIFRDLQELFGRCHTSLRP